ncbi:hypothetical protein [Lacticaseibacillus saniviri]|uniref:SbcC family exonuclease n=1 Tax=Lacticaseibacillus saniviri JCM 17471 = DSM 24301 TaxID=1293598 RepID=A0A0R2MPC0_9LACO|nr:hypothetical protein [Lacticaseibacillus saniviri]KRO15511.1 hypothetical protein IV56_GL002279 [Lacticaseibacillus saniviri JCM 17471 = DSM 24301]MCG4281941.1 SbcC family exonuclease [Lacticaseibacillus saniviri]
MSVESSLHYQQQFFERFNKAWEAQSSFQLYRGLDTTADNLRLPITEAPGYVLAYDKGAQEELHDFLQARFVKFLRSHVPFFEVSDDGHVYFGDWYHRREFGELSVFSRSIVQVTDEEQAILPQLQAFASDPDNYLDNQIEAMRKSVYSEVNHLQNQLESDTATTQAQDSDSSTPNGGGFRSLLKTFIDPTEEEEEQVEAPEHHENQQLRQQFDHIKADADRTFDANKRQLQVSAAITRYEYQAVMSTYSSIAQFENILGNLKEDFMRALEVEGDNQHA